jgi:hypothetical protein
MNARPLARAPAAGKTGGGPAAARRSYAIEQVTEYLRGFELGQVVDLGGACQNNIDYATGMGHRLYAEDVLLTLGAWQGAAGGDPAPETLPPGCLDFPRASVHAALCWDRLQFLAEPAAAALVERLHRILVPGGLLLAMFYSDQGARAPLACRVTAEGGLQVQAVGAARPFQAYSTRAIEKLFQQFDSLKFYLTRENLQEVIVRR